MRKLILLWTLALASLAGPVWADRTIVRIETNFGDILISLLADDASKTVDNFLEYVESDFYDGLIFHRVVNQPDPFVIQAGAYDPNLYLANSGGDPNYFLNPNWSRDPNFFHEPNEPVGSEADNGFSNIRGTVAMALSGGDPDSGTSQFYINLTDNSSSLDPQNFTVFGEVLVGMESNGVVGSIASVATMSIGDSVFKLDNVPDANTPVIISDVLVEWVFEEDSGSFTNVDFLSIPVGNLRTYVGQGDFSGKRYTHTFSEEKFLGVQSLRWRQTEVDEFDVPAFDLSLARDEDGVIWVLDYTLDGVEVVDANSLLEAVTLSQLSSQDMLFKLIVGEFNDVLVNDPNNTITFNDDGLTITEQIVGLNESLDLFPGFDNELIQVRSAIEPNAVMANWRWNHESQGLVLELVDHAKDQGNVDPSGDGWRFLIPDPIEDLKVSFKAGKSRSLPSDLFRLTGNFDIDRDVIANNTLFLFMGPFEHEIAADKFKQSHKGMIFTYRGESKGGGRVFMKINFNKSTFLLRANKENLTGLEEPVCFEMAVENLFSAGDASIRRSRPLPMAFRQGISDSLRVDRFRYVSDDASGFSTSRSLKIRGAIVTQVDPNDLTGQKITIEWAAKTMTIPQSALVRKGQTQKYVYHSNNQAIRRAVFDFDRFRFQVDIRSSRLNRPTGSGQIFSIQFDVTDDARFDQEVKGVAIGNLPKLSGD
jgi:peptidyl-prolyl cis-trans isomerase A (cyclophilin A)